MQFHQDNPEYHSIDYIQRNRNLQVQKSLLTERKGEIKTLTGNNKKNTARLIENHKKNIKKFEFLNKKLAKYEKKYVEIARKIGETKKEIMNAVEDRQQDVKFFQWLKEWAINDLNNALKKLSGDIQSISHQYEKKFDSFFSFFSSDKLQTATTTFDKQCEACERLTAPYEKNKKSDSLHEKRHSKIPNEVIQSALKSYNDAEVRKIQALEAYRSGNINRASPAFRASKELREYLLHELRKVNQQPEKKQEIEEKEIEENSTKLKK